MRKKTNKSKPFTAFQEFMAPCYKSFHGMTEKQQRKLAERNVKLHISDLRKKDIISVEEKRFLLLAIKLKFDIRVSESISALSTDRKCIKEYQIDINFLKFSK